MSLATWALAAIRVQLPNEAIFDGPRTLMTFDGRPVLPSERRLVVVHAVMPSHEGVTLGVSKDRAKASVMVHTYALNRREVEARQRAILRALKRKVPDDPNYEWSMVEHRESRWEDADTTLPMAQLHAFDRFTVVGFEK